MKNILVILLFIWSFVACTNQQDENYSDDRQVKIEKDSLLKTRSYSQDTIVFPASGLGLYAQTQILHFYLGVTTNDFEKMCHEYPELVSDPPTWTTCYIQYRIQNDHTDNWYYYNPNSTLCKTPYENQIFFSGGNTYTAELKSSLFPYSPFQYRAKLFGKNRAGTSFETAWHEDGVYSFETLSGNQMGFQDTGSSGEGVEYVDVSVQFTLDVELHLDARGSTGFTHILKLGDQKSPEFQVGSGQIASFSYSFLVQESMYNLPMNTLQEFSMPFEGSHCGGTFFLDPANFSRYIYIKDFKDIYISGNDRR